MLTILGFHVHDHFDGRRSSRNSSRRRCGTTHQSYPARHCLLRSGSVVELTLLLEPTRFGQTGRDGVVQCEEQASGVQIDGQQRCVTVVAGRSGQRSCLSR
jgi:hypothetical protein